MRFSILIPVYNVERYVEQCLQSVLGQDYTDFEVIIVNDGSTDESPAICKKIAEKDSRIKYYDKKNEGLLLTRRFSINKATGEYVLFLDSDDYWEPGILSKLDKEIKKSHADMICYRFKLVTDDGDFLYDDKGVFPDRSFFTTDNKEDFIREFIRSPRLNVIWSKCVRNEIIDKDADYSAFEDKKGEDLLQSVALIRNAQTILYLDDTFVNYRQTPSGRARNFKLKYIYDYNIVKEHIRTNLIDMKVSDSIMNSFYIRYIEGIVGYLGAVAAVSNNLNDFTETCRHIENFSLYQTSSDIVSSDDIAHSFRNNYINLKKHRYFMIYVYFKTKKAIKKIMVH